MANADSSIATIDDDADDTGPYGHGRPPEPEPEPDLEIDEDFLRRVREA